MLMGRGEFVQHEPGRKDHKGDFDRRDPVEVLDC
jgi:hypothetical protein